MEFRDIIKNRRLEIGKTLEEVARTVGVSKATVQRWESGAIKNLRRDKIAKLAEALDTTPAHLMGWDNISEIRIANKVPLSQVAFEFDVPPQMLESMEKEGVSSEFQEAYAKVVRILSRSNQENDESMIPIHATASQAFLIEQINQLSAEGMKKVMEYVQDLLQTGLYSKK